MEQQNIPRESGGNFAEMDRALEITGMPLRSGHTVQLIHGMSVQAYV